jgi:hypothetical protein
MTAEWKTGGHFVERNVPALLNAPPGISFHSESICCDYAATPVRCHLRGPALCREKRRPGKTGRH